MRYTASNILRHELIGLDVKVVNSTDPTLKGVKGTVIDETRNMLKIRCSNGRCKWVAKEVATFRFTLPTKVRVDVEGRALIGRPEDRVKVKVRYW